MKPLIAFLLAVFIAGASTHAQTAKEISTSPFAYKGKIVKMALEGEPSQQEDGSYVFENPITPRIISIILPAAGIGSTKKFPNRPVYCLIKEVTDTSVTLLAGGNAFQGSSYVWSR